MIRIKYKIALPFMIMIIVIPLLTMLAFNLIMQAYIYNSAKQDLKNAIETTNLIIKQQKDEELFKNSDQERLLAAIPRLKSAIKTSKVVTKTEIIILGKHGKLVYPKTYGEDSFLNERMIEEIKKVDFSKTEAFKILKLDNKKYLVSKHSNKLINYRMIYVLSMDNAKSLISLINLILISIMAISTVICLILSLVLSKGISKPINAINKAANKIGQGEFVQVETITTSQELFELGSSINTMSFNLDKFGKAQKTFLQNASHELRTPLMSVQGYAEGIVNGVFEDNKHAAQIICDESKRLTILVEQLLVLSKIENNTYKINLHKTELNNIMRDFVQRIRGLALKNQKELILNEENSSIFILADDELLSQILNNIIANSIRFAESKVIISIAKDSSNAVIRIIDDGKGVSDSDLPHIFDRFYMGQGGNFGLGLAIAKSSVDAMKGSIKACNSQSGAEFIITFNLTS